MKIARILTVMAALLFSAAPLRAEDAPATEKVDIITPHITDGDHMEIPWILPPFFKEIHLPKYEALQFHVGETVIDLSTTKQV